ncbi:MAG: outer membrane lipoprotein-sorting protein [Pseudomonadota bacterium]
MRWVFRQGLGAIPAALLLWLIALPGAADINPRDIIEGAMEHWRGATSYGEMSMTIQRPDWQRSMSMRSWTEGTKKSLVRVTAPTKDAGNGTLLADNNMWTYAPKINRVIKVPSSMMSQSWMGSDLSNKDIAKSTDVIDQYDHRLVETRQEGEHTVWVIESTPHEDAAVVWGREVFTIRDDYVMLEQQFWDQDDVLVKTYTASDIQQMGGRSVATIMRMQEVDKPDQWTEIKVLNTEFDVDLPANVFTLSNLRNPRQ